MRPIGPDKAGVDRGFLRSLMAMLAEVVLVMPLGCGEAGPGLWPFPP